MSKDIFAIQAERKEWDREIAALTEDERSLFEVLVNDIEQLLIDHGPDGHSDGAEYIALYCLKHNGTTGKKEE